MSTSPEEVPHRSEAHPSNTSNDDPASFEVNDAKPLFSPDESIDEPNARKIQPAEASLLAYSPLGSTEDQPIFASYMRPEPVSERIPHMGHLGLLFLLILCSLVGVNVLVALALHMRLWGIGTSAQAQSDYHYALITQAALYVITFGGCLIFFPLIWRRPFFQGVHWDGERAIQRFGRLVSAAVVCFFVAMVNGILLPGPTDAPIDQLFKAPGAAWVLFGFGITLAPFFEEMAFRGFLLPALCTAWDWSVENLTGSARRPLDENRDPNWSLAAMIFGSLITSLPFALMHGFQTAWSLGPFLLLIFVSLVLCWVRLSTRSLAASTIVHGSYNLMLFAFMLLGTGGFKHLDRM
jgi:membrane protease YdiL (CAAX protease family)